MGCDVTGGGANPISLDHEEMMRCTPGTLLRKSKGSFCMVSRRLAGGATLSTTQAVGRSSVSGSLARLYNIRLQRWWWGFCWNVPVLLFSTWRDFFWGGRRMSCSFVRTPLWSGTAQTVCPTLPENLTLKKVRGFSMQHCKLPSEARFSEFCRRLLEPAWYSG